MKKAFATLLFLSVNIFCFSLPNIKLYENGKFVYEIEDGMNTTPRTYKFPHSLLSCSEDENACKYQINEL